MSAPGLIARTAGRVPIRSWLPRYRRWWLVGDVLAGLVVAALAVPQALGYAGIAGVPVIIGLYSIPLALVAYAALGSSPNLVVGPVSTVSVMSGSLVAGMAVHDPGKAVAYTAALAIGAGLGMLAAGLLRLGWAAEFLSRPIVTGFVFGLVLLIILGEIPGLLGMTPVNGDVPSRAWQILTSLGTITPTAAGIGVAAVVILFAGARWLPRVPWGLVVLVGAIIMSSLADLSADGVPTVGDVPRGLPPLGLPQVGVDEIPQLLFGGLALALVGLAEGLSAARLFAARDGIAIDANQELVATGAANLASGLSSGMGVAGSLSKTAAARRSGSHTQVAGLATAAIVVLTLVAFAPLLAPLPRAVLSAIVIQAVWGLMDLRALQRYRRIRQNDFISAMAAMAGVLVLGPLYGLLIAIGIAVLGLVYRSSRASLEVMGKVPNEKAAWGSIREHPERRTYDGVLVVRLDAPLFFANAAGLHDRLLELVEADQGVRALVLDLEATSQIDTTSVDMLEELLSALRKRNVDLYLVRVFYSARRVLHRSGFMMELGQDHMWHSISAGVRAARKSLRLKGKAHPQSLVDEAVQDAADELDTEADEVLARDVPFAEADANIDDQARPVPRGGYQDPLVG